MQCLRGSREILFRSAAEVIKDPSRKGMRAAPKQERPACRAFSRSQRAPASGRAKIAGRLLAALGHHVVADLLALHQRAQPGALHRADVHEYVPGSVVRLDETETLLYVEEFHGTCGHNRPPSVAHWLPPAFTRRTSEFGGDLRAQPTRGAWQGRPKTWLCPSLAPDRFRSQVADRGRMLGALQRIIVMMIERANTLGIEPQIAHLHEGAEHARARKLLDGKANGLGGRCEPPISERPPRPARALRDEKFRRRRIIEIHHGLSVCSFEHASRAACRARLQGGSGKQPSTRFNSSRARIAMAPAPLPEEPSRDPARLCAARISRAAS